MMILIVMDIYAAGHATILGASLVNGDEPEINVIKKWCRKHDGYRCWTLPADKLSDIVDTIHNDFTEACPEDV